MHISILLMEQIIELFIMIFMGFIIVKTGIVKDEDSKVLSKIVLYLIIPCVIINAFQVDYTSKTVRGLLIAFAASVILQLVLLFIISAMGRLFHMNEVLPFSGCFWFRWYHLFLLKSAIWHIFLQMRQRLCLLFSWRLLRLRHRLSHRCVRCMAMIQGMPAQ